MKTHPDLGNLLTVNDTFYRIRNCIWEADKDNTTFHPKHLQDGDYRFFKVESLRMPEQVSFRSLFEKVISSLTDPGFNYIFILTGSPTGVTLHYGVSRNGEKGIFTNSWNYGDVLRGAFHGNLPGCRLIPDIDINSIRDSMKRYNRAALITGVPFVPQEENDKKRRSGLDMLINSCTDMNWRIVVTAVPLISERVLSTQQAVCGLYDNYTQSARNTLQMSLNTSNSKAESTGESSSHTETEGKSGGTSTGESIARNNTPAHQDTKSGHEDWNKGKSDSKGNNKGTTITEGSTEGGSVSIELTSKQRIEILEYMDKVLFERFRTALSTGMFRTDVYAMAENSSDLFRLQSLICSVFGGNPMELNPLHATDLDFLPEDKLQSLLCNMMNDELSIQHARADQLLFGHNVNNQFCGTSTLLTAKELSAIAGLPECEVPGIPCYPAAQFGLNTDSNEKGMLLGTLINAGIPMPDYHFYLPQSILNRHVLVAGVTGSGKTTTCQRILKEADCPFLVIEPAKTEYRALLHTGMHDKIFIFTLGNENHAPFRLNPFEIMQGENFTSHVDMLTAAFTSAFPMEAALPQVLEEALYCCYEKYGWIESTGKNRFADQPFTEDGRYFPTLSDLVAVIPEVVKKKKFSPQMEGDYIGSLRGRVAALLKGSKGRMLNCRKSIDFSWLIDQCVILEMEDLRSGNDKAFVMGLVLSRVAETIKLRHHYDSAFRHITLIEEAHRLLSKISPAESSARQSAVETFTDLLAEVRKYGESLIIADQIPNKLAADVLKNTNTKIIHKLFAEDDKRAVGEAMMMEREQQSYLASLLPGETVIFTEGTPKPVNVQITRSTDTGQEPSDNEIETCFFRMHDQFDHLLADGSIFGTLTCDRRQSIDMLYPDFQMFCKAMGLFINKEERHEQQRDSIKQLLSTLFQTFPSEWVEEAWRELMWLFWNEKGWILKYFKTLEIDFAAMNVLYHDLKEYAENGEFPCESIENFKNL